MLKAKVLIFTILSITSVSLLEAQIVFKEINGMVIGEAESYSSQTNDEVRRWKLIANKDPVITASNSYYLELLPDTRKTHDDPLIRGENFSNEPGKMAILTYPIDFKTTGRYYVWVRTYSTGTEDNGIHVGLDGEWPDSGQRMQWCEGKNQWAWASKQRTEENHCGEERLIYLDIDEPGRHTLHFSMREDGFAFDKWVLEKEYDKPVGMGPPSTLAN